MVLYHVTSIYNPGTEITLLLSLLQSHRIQYEEKNNYDNFSKQLKKLGYIY